MVAETDWPAVLLVKAAGPGRIRGTALDLLHGMRARPDAPGRVLSEGLRAARYLHSRERRLVGDAVRGVLRDGGVIDRIVPATHDEADDDLRRWLGWLVLYGLPAEEAAAAWPGAERRWQDLADRTTATGRALHGLDELHAAAVLGTCSEALAQALIDSLGPATAAFLAASNQRAPVSLRVNTLKAEVRDAVRALEASGLPTRPMAWAPSGLELEGTGNVVGSAPYRNGLVEIQDEGSQLLAEVVDPGRGPILDLCAGAGGKTLALAALAPLARILATDVRHRALKELMDRARRAGVVHLDVATLSPEGELPAAVARAWRGLAERVLVDAPCSGSGTLRRHPEHRLRLDDRTLAALPEQQARILDRAAPLVAPGGRLIYATCSVLVHENDRVVDAFLQRHREFSLRRMDTVLPPARAARLGDGQVLRLAPHTHGTDGFYAAVLERAP